MLNSTAVFLYSWRKRKVVLWTTLCLRFGDVWNSRTRPSAYARTTWVHWCYCVWATCIARSYFSQQCLGFFLFGARILQQPRRCDSSFIEFTMIAVIIRQVQKRFCFGRLHDKTLQCHRIQTECGRPVGTLRANCHVKAIFQVLQIAFGSLLGFSLTTIQGS